MKIIYNGSLTIGPEREADDILKFTGDASQYETMICEIKYDDRPLAEIIQEDMEDHGRYLSVRYYTNKEAPINPSTVDENFIKTLMGLGDARYMDHYSDITGYLWTDNELNIGGHNLLQELENQVPSTNTKYGPTWGHLYLHLEIEYNKEAKNAQV